jgi:hypothetical protein
LCGIVIKAVFVTVPPIAVMPYNIIGIIDACGIVMMGTEIEAG